MLLAAAALAACGGEDEAAPPTATSSPRAPAAVIVRDGDSALPGAAPRIPVTDAPTPMDADGNVSATRDAVADDGPPGLIVVSDGSHDSLLLEWAGGPANATGWQYRQRRWENMQPLSWEPWTDIPNSGAGTRSYRVTGLRAAAGYEFEVRAVVGQVAGESSVNGTSSPLAEHPARGATHERGALPMVFPYQVVEGDGRTQWRIGYLSIAITIPDGVRLVGGGAFISTPCPAPTAAPGEPEPPNLPGCPGGGGGTSLEDLATGAVLTFGDEGVETNRHVVGPAAQRVHDLFDQLMDSVRAVAW